MASWGRDASIGCSDGSFFNEKLLLSVVFALAYIVFLSILIHFKLSMGKQVVPLATMYDPAKPVLEWPKLLYFYGIGACVMLHIIGIGFNSKSGFLRYFRISEDKPTCRISGRTLSLYIFHQPILICLSAIIPG